MSHEWHACISSSDTKQYKLLQVKCINSVNWTNVNTDFLGDDPGRKFLLQCGGWLTRSCMRKPSDFTAFSWRKPTVLSIHHNSTQMTLAYYEPNWNNVTFLIGSVTQISHCSCHQLYTVSKQPNQCMRLICLEHFTTALPQTYQNNPDSFCFSLIWITWRCIECCHFLQYWCAKPTR